MTDSKKLDLALSKLDKIDILESEIQEVKSHTINIELILKNEINHNINLLPESQNNVIDKLNQSIKVADKTMMYEVQMTSLKSRIENVEKDVAQIKEATA